MKLIGMREFVLEKSKTNIYNMPDDEWIEQIINYAKFLSQPLTIGMFVPCDEEGNMLEEPMYDPANEQYWASAQFQYETAKERVLFEGFEMHRNGKYVVDVLDNPIYFNVGFGWTLYGGGKYTNVESLMSRNITLTQQAIKQIGG